MNQNFNLSPGYISGLAQTDGSFFCSVAISTKHRFGLQFRPKFSLTADLVACVTKYVLVACVSIALRLRAQAFFFYCVRKRASKRRKVNTNLKTPPQATKGSAEFIVEKIDDLQNIIIPH